MAKSALSHAISLGGNCHLAIAQQLLDIKEPSPFRSAWTPLRVLVDLLDSDFAHIADAADLRVEPATEGPGSKVRNARYPGFWWHAWAQDGGRKNPEAIIEREARRIPELAQGLLRELRSGDRFFVRRPVEAEGPDDAMRLWTALARHNPDVRLLYVCADSKRAGRVVEDGPMQLGWLATLPRTPAQYNADAEGWETLCQRAMGLVMA